MAIQITQSDKDRLINIINEGVKVNQEIDDLREGLRETVKAIAEEMSIKPSVLKKAIRTAHKGNFQESADDYGSLENILATVGKIGGTSS